jgi:2,3-bisphosphoglycerate-dependent phosphoglycerate mutase
VELYLIRHSQSENNRLWDLTKTNNDRSDDPGLTETGNKQSVILAEFLSHQSSPINSESHDVQNIRGFFLTHLYTSLMVRAVSTGMIVANRLGLPLIGWEDLHEEGGIYINNPLSGEKEGRPGKNRIYFEKYYPDLRLSEWIGKDGWWNNRPFESEQMCILRARRVIDFVVLNHGDSQDRIALFTHGGFYNKMIKAIFDLPEKNNFWFSMNNSAITRIDFSEKEVAVAYLNRLDFMPREMVT